MTMDPKCCSSCLNPVGRILQTHDLDTSPVTTPKCCSSCLNQSSLSQFLKNSHDPSSEVLAVCFACRGRIRQVQSKKRVASGELVSNSRAPTTRPAPISPAHWEGRGQQSDRNCPRCRKKHSLDQFLKNPLNISSKVLVVCISCRSQIAKSKKGPSLQAPATGPTHPSPIAPPRSLE